MDQPQNFTTPARLGVCDWIVPNIDLQRNQSLGVFMQMEAPSTHLEGGKKVFPGIEFQLHNAIDNNSSSLNPAAATKAPSSDKKMGEKVGIPIGLILLTAIIVAMILLLLRRRRGGKTMLGIASPGNGYDIGKLHSQRTATTIRSVEDHQHDNSFHDEPTRGMELQNQTRSAPESWDWERESHETVSPITASPTSGKGNEFREEIERQLSGRRS